MNFLIKVFVTIALLANCAFSIENPCKKDSKQYHVHPELRGKYIQCTPWGQMFTFSCPTPLVFDENQQACDKDPAQLSIMNALGGFTTAPTTTTTLASQTNFQDPNQQQLFNIQQQLMQLQKLKDQFSQQTKFPQPLDSFQQFTQQPVTASTPAVSEDRGVLVVSSQQSSSDFQQLQPQTQPQQQFQSSQQIQFETNFPQSQQTQQQPQQQFSQTQSNQKFAKQQEDKPVMVVSGIQNMPPPPSPQRAQMPRIQQQQAQQDFFQPQQKQTFQVKSSQFNPMPQKFMAPPRDEEVVEARSVDSKLGPQPIFPKKSLLSQMAPSQLEQIQKPSFAPKSGLNGLLPNGLAQPNGGFPSSNQFNDKTNKTTMAKTKRFQIFPLTSCSVIKCKSGFSCITSPSCVKCNPMCTPSDKLSNDAAIPITCENVICPPTFTCSRDTTDSILKCFN